MGGMRDQIRFYLNALWRGRWYIMMVAWPICLLGWGFVIQLPDIYKARARVYVDADSMLRPLLRGIAADTNALNEIELLERTLLSGPNLTKVGHMADLDLNVKTPTDQEELVNGLRESIARGIVHRMEASGAPAPTLTPDSDAVREQVSEVIGHLPASVWTSVVLTTLESPFDGGTTHVIGLFILFIALQQAWRMTRAALLRVTGPFSLADRPASA